MATDYPKITGAQFHKFLKAKGIPSKCPVCEQRELSYAVNDPDGELEGEAPAVRVQVVLADNPSLGYGQFPQVCLNCGYIRYFRDFEVFDFFADKSDDNGE